MGSSWVYQDIAELLDTRLQKNESTISANVGPYVGHAFPTLRAVFPYIPVSDEDELLFGRKLTSNMSKKRR
jgi:hypothetical protein